MKKKYKNGLVLGRFCPIQNGHCYLIRTAAEQCDMLYVIVGSTNADPIPGSIRYKWVSELFDNDNIKVIWCEDENPQLPSECESLDIFYNNYWVPSVYSRIDKLDVIFTSELYGDEFAHYLGIEHVMVDQPRNTYAISATKIRENPLDNWKFIPMIVRPYYSKTVVIMGPESTGKSTLAYKLAKHYRTNYVKEYGRTYSEQKGVDNLTQEDFGIIANKHQADIKEMVRLGTKVTFIDTEAITTKIFGEMYIPNFDPYEVNLVIKKQQFDLYLVLDIDGTSWVQDGTRRFEAERKAHLERICEELRNRSIPFVLITGNYEEKLEKAIREINLLGDLH